MLQPPGRAPACTVWEACRQQRDGKPAAARRHRSSDACCVRPMSVPCTGDIRAAQSLEVCRDMVKLLCLLQEWTGRPQELSVRQDLAETRGNALLSSASASQRRLRPRYAVQTTCFCQTSCAQGCRQALQSGALPCSWRLATSVLTLSTACCLHSCRASASCCKCRHIPVPSASSLSCTLCSLTSTTS